MYILRHGTCRISVAAFDGAISGSSSASATGGIFAASSTSTATPDESEPNGIQNVVFSSQHNISWHGCPNVTGRRNQLSDRLAARQRHSVVQNPARRHVVSVRPWFPGPGDARQLLRRAKSSCDCRRPLSNRQSLGTDGRRRVRSSAMGWWESDCFPAGV